MVVIRSLVEVCDVPGLPIILAYHEPIPTHLQFSVLELKATAIAYGIVLI